MRVISDKKLQKAINWTPHPAQKKILDSPARHKVICAGTRFGKSMLCAYVAFKHLLSNNQRIWVVSLTYDMAGKIFDYVKEFAAQLEPGLLKNATDRPPQRIEFKEQNSWLECKSADVPNSLMGEEIDLSILDEASRMKPDIWKRHITARLTSRKGDSFIISTPAGQNWFHQEWIKAKEAEDSDSFRFTSNDNPYFKKTGEWDRLKKVLPEQIFEQEYKAEFLPDAAAVFRGIDEIIKDDCLKDAIPEHRYVMGVDLGKHQDFTVITVIDKYNNHVVYWDRFKKIDYTLQKKRIEAIAKRYNNARIVVDSTVVGEPIKEDLERKRLFVDDFTFTGKSKKDLIDKLSIYIQENYIQIPPIDTLTDELKSFGYQLRDPRTGRMYKNIKYSAPQGMHDDCVDSLALAVWGLTGKASPKTPVQKELSKGRSRKIQSFV